MCYVHLRNSKQCTIKKIKKMNAVEYYSNHMDAEMYLFAMPETGNEIKEVLSEIKWPIYNGLLIELGPGPKCYFVDSLKDWGIKKYMAIDCSQEMLSCLEKQHKDSEYMISTQCADLSKDMLDCTDGSVDMIVSNHIISFMPNIGHLFSEVYRVLKTGSIFCLYTSYQNSHEGALMQTCRCTSVISGVVSGMCELEHYYHNDSEIKRIAKESGFRFLPQTVSQLEVEEVNDLTVYSDVFLFQK